MRDLDSCVTQADNDCHIGFFICSLKAEFRKQSSTTSVSYNKGRRNCRGLFYPGIQKKKKKDVF